MMKRIAVMTVIGLVLSNYALFGDVATNKYLFDLGKGPAWDDFVKISYSSYYSESTGYGFLKENARMRVFESTKPDGLCKTGLFIESGIFRVKLPDDKYIISILTGEMDIYLHEPLRPETFRLSVNGAEKYAYTVTPQEYFSEKYLFRGMRAQYRKGDERQRLWERYVEPRFLFHTIEAESKNGIMDIKILSADDASNWNRKGVAVTAIIICPQREKQEFDELVKNIQRKRKQEFLNSVGSVEVYIDDTPEPDITAEQKEKGYVLFVRNYMEKVYPSTKPKAEEIKDTVKLFSPLGEYETATVGIYPLKDLKSAALKPGDLIGPGQSKISKDLVAINPVIYKEKTGKGITVLEPAYYIPMESIDIQEGITQQFWIDVKVPENATPGIYEGKLIFQVDGKPDSILNIKLNVLPFKLAPLSYPMTLRNYPYGYPLDGVHDQWWFEENKIRKMKEYGLTTAETRCEPGDKGKFDKHSAAILAKEIEIIKKLDFPVKVIPLTVYGYVQFASYYGRGNPFPVGDDRHYEYMREQIEAIENERKKQGWPEFVYFLGAEWRGNTNCWDPRIFEQMRKIKGIRIGAGGNTDEECRKPAPLVDVCAINGQTFTSSAVGEESIFKLAAKTNTEIWLYQGARDRFFYGFFFWRVNAKGLYKEMWHLSYGEPFNPFDCQDDLWSFFLLGPEGYTIPSIHKDGSATELREGVEDLKYLKTLENLIEKARRKDNENVKSARNKAENILSSLRDNMPIDYAYYYRAGGEWEIKQYDELRWKIGQAIIELKRALEE